MLIDINSINSAVKLDAAKYIESCDENFNRRISDAANLIEEKMKIGPLVLLSGPTASGKTTSALMIAEALREKGINAHTVSLDDYFNDVEPGVTPMSEDGGYDFESPLCLDLPLLDEHFDALSRGEGIDVPSFDFPTQKRKRGVTHHIDAGKDRIVIFEGIHALGELVGGRHPEATRVFVNAASDIVKEGEPCFYGRRIRLARRLMRDYRVRGATPEYTLELWDNVRKNEIKNILPAAETADLVIDSTLGYEVGVMKTVAMPMLRAVSPYANRYNQVAEMIERFELFEEIDPALVPPSSLLREFIGGGLYTE